MGVLIDIGLRKLWFASYDGNKIHGAPREGRRFFGMCTMGLLQKLFTGTLLMKIMCITKKIHSALVLVFRCLDRKQLSSHETPSNILCYSLILTIPNNHHSAVLKEVYT